MNDYNWFITPLIQRGWSFTPLEEKQDNHYSSEAKRVLGLIKETSLNFQHFIQHFQKLTSPGEDSWFLSYSDYFSDTDEGFSWNEYEKLSIQSAEEEEDNDEKILITKFWDSHLPFAYSVRNGYSYLAIGVSGVNEGKIIYGREPIFEDFSIEANSFEEFLSSFLLVLTTQKSSSILLDFI